MSTGTDGDALPEVHGHALIVRVAETSIATTTRGRAAGETSMVKTFSSARSTVWRSEETMSIPESPEPFSLLGGPLHQVARRLRLIRGDTNSVLLGLALGWGLWFLIAALALMEGVTDRMFSMSLVAGHARLLLVIPLFFICESWVVPRMTAFVGTIARSGVVPAGARTALAAEVSRTRR